MMQYSAWIGWMSSLILLVTLGKQVSKRWKEKTVQGVSKWLFTGQVGAELGFVIYSYLQRDWVFVATNFALLIENFVGLIVFYHYRSREKGKKSLRLVS